MLLNQNEIIIIVLVICFVFLVVLVIFICCILRNEAFRQRFRCLRNSKIFIGEEIPQTTRPTTQSEDEEGQKRFELGKDPKQAFQKNHLEDIEMGGEFRQYSKQDKQFTNLLEIVGTPRIDISDEETLITTRNKRGIFAELEAFKAHYDSKEAEIQ